MLRQGMFSSSLIMNFILSSFYFMFIKMYEVASHLIHELNTEDLDHHKSNLDPNRHKHRHYMCLQIV